LCWNSRRGLLRAGPEVHRVAAEQLVGAVAGQHYLDAHLVDAPEQRDRDHLVDDVAVLGQLTQPDGLPDVGPPDVAGPHLDDLVWRELRVGQAFGQDSFRLGQVLWSRPGLNGLPGKLAGTEYQTRGPTRTGRRHGPKE
jgi:hypothetical protein